MGRLRQKGNIMEEIRRATQHPPEPWCSFFCHLPRAVLIALGIAAVFLSSANVAAQNVAQVDLRVLVIAVGSAEQDPERALMEELLQELGVPYDVIDSSRQELTASDLSSAERGRYNGIILTQSETYLPDGRLGFDADEFEVLHDYERRYGVRESVMSGFPATNGNGSLDYGISAAHACADIEGQWVGEAGGTALFEYVNTNTVLPISGAAFAGVPRNDSGAPEVQPLLVDASDPAAVLVSKVTHPDGREVLLCTINNASSLLHSRVLAYEFLNFATSGVFIGARRVYLAVHTDDLFLGDEVWNPETNANLSEELAFRLADREFAAAVDSLQQFQETHPLARRLIVDLAFNAVGAGPWDDLTDAVVKYGQHFGFINHTFEALQMDRLCDVPWSGDCPRTAFFWAYNDMLSNVEAWFQYGFPGAEQGQLAVVTDSHSGLSDRKGTRDQSDDVPFPAGFNQALGRAAEALGVRTLASDHSQPNQDRIQRVPGFDIVLLPRYPTSLFYNTTTPEELVSEYNYLYHDRYLESDQDPCLVPGAICEPRNYDGILDVEADTTVRHMLSYAPFPHFFHQSNLHIYDEAGHTLEFDWLDRVMTVYEHLVDLPVQNRRFYELADIAWNVVKRQEAAPAGYWDRDTGSVTLWADQQVSIDVTGLSGGSIYGGQRQRTVQVSPTPITLPVDVALDR